MAKTQYKNPNMMSSQEEMYQAEWALKRLERKSNHHTKRIAIGTMATLASGVIWMGTHPEKPPIANAATNPSTTSSQAIANQKPKTIEAPNYPKVPTTITYTETVTHQHIPNVLRGNYYFSQTARPYHLFKYGYPIAKYYIGDVGCGPTSMAMVFSTLTGKIITPIEAAKFNMARANVDELGNTFAIKAVTDMAKAEGLHAATIARNPDAMQTFFKEHPGAKMVAGGFSGGAKNTPATELGHIWVIDSQAGYDSFRIEDPASIDNSYRTWSTQELFKENLNHNQDPLLIGVWK